jgi:hypothetical protein
VDAQSLAGVERTSYRYPKSLRSPSFLGRASVRVESLVLGFFMGRCREECTPLLVIGTRDEGRLMCYEFMDIETNEGMDMDMGMDVDLDKDIPS